MASFPLSSPLVLALGSSVAAQLTKFFVTLGREGSLNFKRLVELGGMPSAHSASVAALSTGVALEQGVASPLFRARPILSSFASQAMQAYLLDALVPIMNSRHGAWRPGQKGRS